MRWCRWGKKRMRSNVLKRVYKKPRYRDWNAHIRFRSASVMPNCRCVFQIVFPLALIKRRKSERCHDEAYTAVCDLIACSRKGLTSKRRDYLFNYCVCSFLHYIFSSILCNRHDILSPESHTVVLSVLTVSSPSVAAARQLPPICAFSAFIFPGLLSAPFTG